MVWLLRFQKAHQTAVSSGSKNMHKRSDFCGFRNRVKPRFLVIELFRKVPVDSMILDWKSNVQIIYSHTHHPKQWNIWILNFLNLPPTSRFEHGLYWIGVLRITVRQSVRYHLDVKNNTSTEVIIWLYKFTSVRLEDINWYKMYLIEFIRLSKTLRWSLTNLSYQKINSKFTLFLLSPQNENYSLKFKIFYEVSVTRPTD